MSFNKIILVGNLGRDPELKYTPQGNPVCNFSVATNERRRDRAGEQQDVTTWFRVSVFGRQAETAAQYLVKGRPVYIEGRLRLEEWTDREGRVRQSLEVVATDVQFIGGRQDDASAPSTATRSVAASNSPASTGTKARDEDFGPELSDDDIPF